DSRLLISFRSPWSFFSRSGCFLHVHSFPTRRSSDLDAKAAESARSVDALAYTAGRNVVIGAGQYTGTPQGRHLLAHELTHVVQRSEEHTSELQSLTNLVCRLLLEKKQYTNDAVSRPT